jgi:hypothetical protein
MPVLLNPSRYATAGGGASWAATVAALSQPPIWWSRLADTSSPFTDATGAGHTLPWGTGVTGNVAGGTSDGDKAMTAGTAESTLASAAWMDTPGSWWGAVLLKTSTTGTERVALARSSNASTYEWTISVSTGNKALIRCQKSGTNNNALGATTITDGNWHLVVGTWDGSNIRVYVDGALDGTSSAFSGTMLTGHTLRLGGMGGVRLWTPGDGLDEAMFGGGSGTTSFLSATDVSNLAAAR